MINTRSYHHVWRLLLTIGIALTFISCGTSTIGNPGSSGVISFGINGQDMIGVLFRYRFDSVTNRWDITIEPSTTLLTPEKPWGDSLVNKGDTTFYATGLSGYRITGGVEYRFCLIDSDSIFTTWRNDSTITYTWPDAGNYYLMAQARSVTDSSKVSFWSQQLPIKAQ